MPQQKIHYVVKIVFVVVCFLNFILALRPKQLFFLWIIVWVEFSFEQNS